MTRVLLLEDNLSLADSIRRSIEAAGHGVTWFRDLRAARHTIPPIGFHVLLCDYELPDGTGIDFLRDVNGSTFLGLARPGWTSILWSGLDRSAEVAASGLKIDHVLLKEIGTTSVVLDLIEKARDA